jgi:hypothetical protein
MTTEEASTLIIFVAAPATTLFPILYMLTAPWYRSLVGWAIVISKLGLAALVDASLAFHFFGPHYAGRPAFVLGAFSLIVVGTWLYLFALIREQLMKRPHCPPPLLPDV